MKTKRFSKSMLSLLLTLLMVISMTTIGLVSANSAEVDETDPDEIAAVRGNIDDDDEDELVESGASVMEVYFTKPSGWGSATLHYWGGSESTNWPGKAMNWKYNNDMGESVYYLQIPGNTTGIIFSNNGSSQTSDINVAGKQVVAYYISNGQAVAWPTPPEPSVTTPTEAPTTPVTPGETKRIYFADATEGHWITTDDANLFAYVNNAYTQMTESVDETTGLVTWYADIENMHNGISVKYLRANPVAKAKNLDYTKANTGSDVYNWNCWTSNYDASQPLVKATGDASVELANLVNIPEGTATDYWYGIWADPKGDGDVNQFVKIYSENYNSDRNYVLYLPSHTNLSSLTIYTSLYDLKIGSTSVSRATAKTMSFSNGSSYNISFKRRSGGTTYTGTLKVIKTTATAAMMMTTPLDMYSKTTVGVAANDGGMDAYKSYTTQKSGNYYFYDEAGKLLNSDTAIKKIKGRGNSSFEASMKLYGKYAYNLSLSKKAKLVEGANSSKKWCLLANNMDESMLRNTLIYAIGDEVGVPYSPNTRLIDLYDNGNYLGAYIIAEKVEYGKDTLVDSANSLDKMNEDVLAAGKGIDYDALVQKTSTYTVNGHSYTYSYSVAGSADAAKGLVYEYDDTSVTLAEGEDPINLKDKFKEGDFQLEHEIDERYQAEASWFRSNTTGQAVVPKYPEFATQNEMKWMIEKYDAMQTAVYNNDYNTYKNLIDVKSFADVYLIQELTMNLDACATSYYILGGASYDKLIASPLWDYDWAAGAYNGKRMTTTGEIDVADYNKTYVKDKSVKTGSGENRPRNTYNLQAQLAHNASFWTDCKREWTNKFVPALNKYLGNNGVLLKNWMPAFRSAANMNEARFGYLEAMYQAAKAGKGDSFWGTRSTARYYTNNFGIGTYLAGGSNATNYDNTVYYLNDWLVKRQAYMHTNMGLYDANLIETEAPTEAPTDAPTEAPTDPATEAPTDAPTEAPTDAPTEAPTDAPETYIIGDADGDGVISVSDATAIQKYLAQLADFDRIETRGKVYSYGNTLSITDATAIQKYLAMITVDGTKEIGSSATF